MESLVKCKQFSGRENNELVYPFITLINITDVVNWKKEKRKKTYSAEL